MMDLVATAVRAPSLLRLFGCLRKAAGRRGSGGGSKGGSIEDAKGGGKVIALKTVTTISSPALSPASQPASQLSRVSLCRRSRGRTIDMILRDEQRNDIYPTYHL